MASGNGGSSSSRSWRSTRRDTSWWGKEQFLTVYHIVLRHFSRTVLADEPKKQHGQLKYLCEINLECAREAVLDFFLESTPIPRVSKRDYPKRNGRITPA